MTLGKRKYNYLGLYKTKFLTSVKMIGRLFLVTSNDIQKNNSIRQLKMDGLQEGREK